MAQLDTGGMTHGSRNCVTVDLRGLGARLQSRALASDMTTAALVRKAVTVMLGDEPDDPVDGGSDIAPGPRHRLIKVTLRLPAAHTLLLTRRARAAEVSHGVYVAGLIEGSPPAPRSPDHREAVAALVASTDRLAAMSVGLNAFMRLLAAHSTTNAERYRAGLVSLADDVRHHLAAAASLFSELGSARRR
jgi:hypothetical protein